MKPYIGITVDGVSSQTSNPHPFYRVRQLYADAIEKAGGIPVLLPWSRSSVNDYAQKIDGLVLVGGDDIDPKLYGETTLHPTVSLVWKERTDFEWAMLDAVAELKKPILGICGGMQLLNVWAGGTLYQDTSLKDGCYLHEQGRRQFFSHSIRLDAASALYRIAGRENVYVNSFHHQIVRDVPSLFKAVAWSEDDIVEAIESVKHPYVWGLQWHPEYGGQYDEKWIEAWVDGCSPHS